MPPPRATTVVVVAADGERLPLFLADSTTAAVAGTLGTGDSWFRCGLEVAWGKCGDDTNSGAGAVEASAGVDDTARIPAFFCLTDAIFVEYYSSGLLFSSTVDEYAMDQCQGE